MVGHDSDFDSREGCVKVLRPFWDCLQHIPLPAGAGGVPRCCGLVTEHSGAIKGYSGSCPAKFANALPFASDTSSKSSMIWGYLGLSLN